MTAQRQDPFEAQSGIRAKAETHLTSVVELLGMRVKRKPRETLSTAEPQRQAVTSAAR
jgi:hypothetical protein